MAIGMWKKSSTENDVQRAGKMLKAGRAQEAFALLNAIKQKHVSAENVDYLRARCFMAMSQPWAAFEAAKEELRFFPENKAATQLLRELEPQTRVPEDFADSEFEELYQKIRFHTMVGVARLRALFALAKEVCTEDLEGDFVECGVAAGGTSALLASVIKRHSKRPRKLYAFDSFEGMPRPSNHDVHCGTTAPDTGWGEGTCAAPETSLIELCAALGVRELVQPVKGLFGDTLPAWRERIGRVALLHVDGDWYSSTSDVLNNLYEQVEPGGRIQVDDYGYWEGCRRAVEEFQNGRGFKWQLHRIDDTGAWFAKDRVTPELLNLGCGRHFHPLWTNVDLRAHSPGVIEHNLRSSLPFAEKSFDAVYHSHLIEHLPRDEAPGFLKECARILRPRGVLRIATPDLETIARLYLKYLEAARDGDPDAAAKYDWITLELMDQMVRTRSGGDMLAYWRQTPMPAEEFVIERAGEEARGFLARERGKPNPPNTMPPPSAADLANFLQTGELHKWMYDRFSLGRLLTAAGFVEVRQCSAHESAIPRFREYLLDETADGRVRKPDSFFIEARKP